MNIFKRHKTYRRKAHHAGSWYLNDSEALNENLSSFINAAQEDKHEEGEGLPRGLIAPHAGLSHSGSTAAYAYLALKESLSNRATSTVLVLHPSHRVYLNGCAISGASSIETPIGSIPIDDDLRSELMKTDSFSLMDQLTDESEHSAEMHFPFISKCFMDARDNYSSSQSSLPQLRVLPIMVGAISTSQEVDFGKILAPFVARPNIFTAISSDFCHWGKRFQYSPMPPGKIETSFPSISSSEKDGGDEQIYEYIERLDRIGMDHICLQRPATFAVYIKNYKNTICGKAPIAVYLNAIETNKHEGREGLNLTFVKYAQSNQVKSINDCSVSYASAIARKV